MKVDDDSGKHIDTETSIDTITQSRMEESNMWITKPKKFFQFLPSFTAMNVEDARGKHIDTQTSIDTRQWKT